MKVSDAMTEPVVTVRSDALLQEAAALMIHHRVSGLPVVDAAGTLIGMLTEGDIIRRAELGTVGSQGGRPSRFLNSAQCDLRRHGLTVAQTMTRDIITTSPEAPLADLVDVMESQQVKRLPVLRNQKLVGIVSRADLVRALLQPLPARSLGSGGRKLRRLAVGEILSGSVIEAE